MDETTLQSKDTKSKGQLKALADEHTRLANPLGEDKIAIQRTGAGGTKIVEERKLFDTMQRFERGLQNKRSELQSLLDELKDIDTEIATVKQDVLAVEQKQVKKLKRDLDAQVASLVEEAEASQKTVLAEVEKARKQERTNVDVQNKKFEELLKTMF